MMKRMCWLVEQSKQNYRGKEVGRGPDARQNWVKTHVEDRGGLDRRAV